MEHRAITVHQRLRTTLAWLLTLIAIVTVARHEARAGTMAQYEAHKREKVRDLAAKCAAIVESHKADPAMVALQARLQMIDSLARRLVRDFESVRSSSLLDLLGEEHGSTGTAKAMRQRDWALATPALETYQAYRPKFAAALPMPDLAESEIKIIKQYYDAVARAAAEHIAKSGQFIQGVSEDLGCEVRNLCLVVPFLHVPDEEWTEKQVHELPQWMRRPQDLIAMKVFSLKAIRPQTAYQFERYARKRIWDAANSEYTYLSFLADTTKELFHEKEYVIAVRCLREGIRILEREHKSVVLDPLRHQLAELSA